MYEFSVDSAFLLAIFAGTLALFFDYFPGVAQWFDGLNESQKKLLNLGGVALVAVVIFVGDCYGLFSTNLLCEPKGAIDLAYMVFVAVTVNYGFHKATKPSAALQARMFGEAKG